MLSGDTGIRTSDRDSEDLDDIDTDDDDNNGARV